MCEGARVHATPDSMLTLSWQQQFGEDSPGQLVQPRLCLTVSECQVFIFITEDEAASLQSWRWFAETAYRLREFSGGAKRPEASRNEI